MSKHYDSTSPYASAIEWARAESIVWTATQAAEILADHSHTDAESLADFMAKLGMRNTYRAADVLSWLGY